MRTLTKGLRASSIHCGLTLILCLSALGACKSAPETTPPRAASKDPDAALNEVFAKMPVQGLIKVRVKPEGVFVDDEQVLIFETPYKVSDKDNVGNSSSLMIQPLYDAVCELIPSIEEGKGEVFKCKPREAVLMFDGDASYRLLIRVMFTVLQASVRRHRILVQDSHGDVDILSFRKLIVGTSAGFIGFRGDGIDMSRVLSSDGSKTNYGDLKTVDACLWAVSSTCNDSAKDADFAFEHLYSFLYKLKLNSPNVEMINVSLDDELPISLLVRFFKVALYKRIGSDSEGRFVNSRSFQNAYVPIGYDVDCRSRAQDKGDAPMCLFPDIVLSVVN